MRDAITFGGGWLCRHTILGSLGLSITYILTMLLPIHIVAGAFAIVLGAVALLASKGAVLHRRSGLLFVYAMVTMGVSGSILAARHSFTNPNVLGGFVSAYFVITALTTVRSRTAWTRRLNVAALVLAIALVVFEISLGIRAMGQSREQNLLEGVPFFGMPLLMMALITALAAAGDVRMMRSGALRAGSRLSRHLWRMCFALFIAAGSFFSIPERVAKILPYPFTTPGMRALPIVLIFVAMFYWLWRVRSRRSQNGTDAVPALADPR